jgi:class 3 adenylate cyclase
MALSYNPPVLAMEKDRLEEPLEVLPLDQDSETLTPTEMTILFSDIMGSTAYAEKKGDIEYMSMISRHNGLLFPVIAAEGGRVIKTIGDAILAKFDDPVSGIRGAVGMQRVLAKDREGREDIDQIRIRIGLHQGLGLVKNNPEDVFGDVVNVASRIQHQAEPEQILITDKMLDSAQSAGFECATMGRAEIKGKDEPIDLYAVAWSESATRQLIDELTLRYEKRLKDFKKQHTELDEEYENARDQWRAERRNLTARIEQLEESVARARQNAKDQVSEDLQSELRFQLEDAERARQQLEHDLSIAYQKFEAERNNLKAQIAGMQATVLEAMERSNNPARVAMVVREQVEMRLAEAKQDWQLQWEGERKRLNAEMDRLRRAGSGIDDKKEAARRALLEKLGKMPASPGGPAKKTAGQWESESEMAKIQWDTEREQLKLKIKKLETDIHRAEDVIRTEIYQELRAQFEPQIAQSNRERQRLEQEIQTLTRELASERQRLNFRIEQMVQAIPQAQEAGRKQAAAELRNDLEEKLEEATRLRARFERKHQDALEELEEEKRRAKKEIAALVEQLKEAKATAFKAARTRS